MIQGIIASTPSDFSNLNKIKVFLPTKAATTIIPFKPPVLLLQNFQALACHLGCII